MNANPQRHRSLADSNSAQYDGADRKVQSLDAGGHATRWELDARGNPIRIADADGYSLGFEYDAMDRWVVAYDKEGNAVTRNLDISGRARAVTDANGITITTTWYGVSKNGRLKEQIVPDGTAQGRKTTYDYDPNGNLISVTDNASQVARIHYDAANRPVRSAGPLVNGIHPVTCTQYDLLGQAVELWAGSTTDPAAASCDLSGADLNLKKQTSVLFDDFGRALKQTDPLGQTATASYDRHGNVLAATDAKNQTTELNWTYGHQLQTRTVKNADGSVYTSDSLTRNPLGQPIAVSRSNPAQVQTMTYDAAHRLVRSTDSRNSGATKALDYDWSPGGMLNLMQDSDGNRTDYLYDGVGRLIGIWAPNFDYLAFSHDAGGRLTEKPAGLQRDRARRSTTARVGLLSWSRTKRRLPAGGPAYPPHSIPPPLGGGPRHERRHPRWRATCQRSARPHLKAQTPNAAPRRLRRPIRPRRRCRLVQTGTR